MVDDVCTVALSGSLGFAWSASQKVTVFQKSSNCSQDSTLYEVRYFASAKKDVFMQRLIRASYDIFRVSQVCKNSLDLLRLSHQYRAVLAMCYQEIYEFVGACNNNVPTDRLVALTADGDLVKTYELLWHLAEVVLLQTLGPEKLTSALSDWYFVQSQESMDMARNLLDKSNLGKNSLKMDKGSELVFWSTALSLTLQVRPMEVCALLASHPKANSQLFRDVRQLLIAMPLDNSNSSSVEAWQNGGSLEKAWHHWQSVCNIRLMEETRGSYQTQDIDSEYLILIISILAGRHDCWNDPRVLHVCEDWYFRFVGWLFYTHHFIDTASLFTALGQFKPKFDTSSSDPSTAHSFSAIVDEVIKHIFAEDILSVVFTLSEKFNNWWMVAHFANLVKLLLPDFFSGINSSYASPELFNLKSEDTDSAPKMMRLASTMPDFFLMRYAESIAADPGLLSVSLGYLDHCTTLQPTARSIQASFLQRTKPSTTRLTHSLIQLARKHQLHEVVGEISRTKSRALLSRSHLPTIDIASDCSALGWAIVARDVQLIARIITRTLSYSMSNDYADADSWNAVKEVASIVTCLFGNDDRGASSRQTHSWLTPLVASPELAFISRYAKFHCQLLAANDTRAMIHTALDLLSSNDSSGGFHLPLKFRIHLLKHLKPHLSPTSMGRSQSDALGAVVTELKATLRLLGRKEEDVESLLISLSALLVQARAVSILRRDDGLLGGRLSSSQPPTEYAVSDIGDVRI